MRIGCGTRGGKKKELDSSKQKKKKKEYSISVLTVKSRRQVKS